MALTTRATETPFVRTNVPSIKLMQILSVSKESISTKPTQIPSRIRERLTTASMQTPFVTKGRLVMKPTSISCRRCTA